MELKPDDDIRVLSLQDAVRVMPGMYFGGVDKHGVHRAIEYVLEEVVDDAIAWDAPNVRACIEQDGSLTISNDGPGLPLDIEPFQHKSRLELALISSALANWTLRPYRLVHIGMGRYYLVCTNAASEWFTVQVKRDSHLWQQTCQMGIPQTDVVQVRALSEDEPTGSCFQFRLDEHIFPDPSVNAEALYQRLRELAFLVSTLSITFEDHSQSGKRASIVFSYPHGLADYVLFLNRHYMTLHDPIARKQSINVQNGENNLSLEAQIEVALQYSDSVDSLIVGYVNGRNLPDGGSHVDGALNGLARVIKTQANMNASFTTHEWQNTDFLHGLALVISVWYAGAKSSNAVFRRLANPELEYPMAALVEEAMIEFGQKHSDKMKGIVDHCVSFVTTREQRLFGK